MKRRVPELDGLRGVAILLVLCWHLLPGMLVHAPPRLLKIAITLNRFSWSGVDLFFVLSGFLIGGILIDNRESARYFTTFYARRFYRILPLYAAMVGVFVLWRYAGPPAGMSWLFTPSMPLWSYVTLTQNFTMARAGAFGAQWLGPTWSLAIEEQFYLLLPPLIAFVPRERLWLTFFLLAAMAPVTRFVLFLFYPPWAMSGYVLMPARADALMFGVLAALMLRDPRLHARVLAQRRMIYTGLAALAFAVVAMALLRLSISSPGMVLAGFSILSLFYAVVLVLAVTAPDGDILGRVLRLSPLRRTGTLAYALYLLHLPVFGICALFVHSAVLSVVVAVAMTFVLAALSWRYFEAPLVERGHRYNYGELERQTA